MTRRRLLPVLVLLACAGVFAAPSFAQSTVSISKTIRGGAATDLAVPVNVSPGDGITAMDFTFTYDAAVLAPAGVYRTGYANAFTVSPDLGTPGTVRLSLSSPTALPAGSSGDVCWVVFHTVGASGTFSNLAWISARLNGGAIPATTSDGKVTLVTAASLLSVPDTAVGGPGTQVVVPINVAPADGGEAFDLAVAFNPNVISAVSVSKTPLSAPFTLTYNVATPGEVRISLFGTSAISGSGPLANITFNVTGPLGSVTPLDLFRGDINERGITSNLDDGLFTVCSTADADGDGYTGCAHDCNDADPAVHPNATELCNGKDDNCNGSIDEGFDVGAACSAGLGVCLRSGATVCTANGASTTCSATPGTPGTETCNGLDDDCDGTVDNHVAAPAQKPAVTVTRSGLVATIAWSAPPDAQGYDVQRGALKALLADQTFYSGTTACMANDTTSTATDDSGVPAVTDGFWYLVRASNCGGNGTYDDGTQQGSRDPQITASPFACP